MEPWWIDTDPGVDDALAIRMMLAAPQIRVLGLGVVAGNVDLGHTLANACQLADRAPYALSVHPGAAAPLIGGLADAAFVHGQDGFGDAGLPPARTTPAEPPAALALLEAARRYPGQLCVLALGPLTNLALALMLEPGLPRLCRRLVVLGGALGARGNTANPSAEFNFAFDPEAAAIVLARWPGLELLDWELAVALAPRVAEVDQWLAGPGEGARFLHRISRVTARFVHSQGMERWVWADPLAAWAATAPDADFAWREVRVAIALAPGPTRGQSVVDWNGLGRFRQAPIRIATAGDRDRFHAAIRAVL
jgi:purine nucleosidase